MSKCVSWPLAAAMIVCVAVGMPLPAHAAEDQVAALQECVKLNTSGRDRLVTASWFISALAAAPQLADIVTVDPAKKQQLDKDMAQLFTRLLTVDCLAEARAIVKSGNSAQIQQAGTTLGEIAMQEVMADKDAAASISAYAAYLKPSDFDLLRN